MEQNTYATSIYINAPVTAATQYLTDGKSLDEYTLFSRMQKQVDEHTWLGTASGYQNGLYYHVKEREVGAIKIVEWHCGPELGKYFHVYPMMLFSPSYFAGDSKETGTYYHWISFVDPARRTPMIQQGLPTVHRSEARSLKAQLERRQGHERPISGALELRSHTIFVDAPLDTVASYLSDTAKVAEWGYMLRADGEFCRDAYDHPVEVTVTRHDLGAYQVIEHDTRYVKAGVVVRTPMVVIPASYAFAAPNATGVILHRISAWPKIGERDYGKSSPDDYDTEAINAKRIIERIAGNLTSYDRGVSYRTGE